MGSERLIFDAFVMDKNRAQPAGEVYVTGSFDNWGKSTKLNKQGDAFIATVSLPSEKILYKVRC